MEGKLFAPESPVGLFVFVDFKKIPNLISFFLFLFLIFRFCKTLVPLSGELLSVTSVICILSCLERL